MNLESQVLFFFSAIGAFNGLFLSSYFAFFAKPRSQENYFLSTLLFVVSVRVAKSVFLIFYPAISSLFIQIGLSACALIGPFLYLYVRAAVGNKKPHRWHWVWHTVPITVAMALVGYFYPYWHNRSMWQMQYVGHFGWILYVQWLVYVIASFFIIKNQLIKLFSTQNTLSDKEVWLTTVVIGVAIIWLAYNTVSYTSYIVGALSFSFVFYLSLLLWIFKRKKTLAFFEKPAKYANKKISVREARALEDQLGILLSQQPLYRDPALKVSDLARHLQVTPHYLSQYLNDNLGKSFSAFVNEYRVKAAEEMLTTHHQLTLEAIGNECGFKSKSSFYAAFKKYRGVTPAQRKKMLN